MFGIGTTELILIGIVALIVVGPKDLPLMFRTLGRFTGKARAMAREFSRAMEDAANQAGVKDATDALKAASNPRAFGMDKLTQAADSFEKWDPMGKSSDKTDDKAEAKPASTLSEERAEAARKISEKAAEKALERQAREAAEAEAATVAVADPAEGPAPDAAAKPKPARKKTTAQPAKKAAPAKAATKTTAAKKTTRKPAAKKPAAKDSSTT